MEDNKLIIDLDSSPYLQDSWNMIIEQHLEQGQLKINSNEIFTLLSEKSTRAIINGSFVQKGSVGWNGLNANFLDYLLAHPELIPTKDLAVRSSGFRDVYFWGTIYRHKVDNGLWVRVLIDCAGRATWRWGYITKDWGKEVPASLSDPRLNYLH